MEAIDLLALGGKYGVGLVIFSCLALAGYRILFHPLARYPGPFIAKITDGYGGFHAFKKDLHLASFRNFAKYGPVVRVGPNRVIFNTPAALKDIYNNDRLQKSFTYSLQLGAKTTPNTFNVVDKSLHRRKRKLVEEAFSIRSMRRFEPVLLNQVNNFVKLLAASASVSESSPVNMTSACRHLGVDIIGELAFGFPLRTLTTDTYRFVNECFTLTSHRMNTCMTLPLIKTMNLQDLIFPKGTHEFVELIKNMLAIRLAQDRHAKADLFSFLTENAAEHDLGKEELIKAITFDSTLVFGAGSDTSSTALAGLFFYLSRNHDAYTSLTHEIRATFTRGTDIVSGPALTSCVFLRACINETLRLSPPFTGAAMREIDLRTNGPAPLLIDGHPIPPGAQVGVSTYALHHNPDAFPDPFTFRPQRWLTQDTDELKKMNASFAPFSIGARNCAGKPLAMLELSLAMARTIWYLDFETAPGLLGIVGGGVPKPGRTDGRGRIGEFQLYDVFVSAHDGPYLVFKPRGKMWTELGEVDAEKPL